MRALLNLALLVAMTLSSAVTARAYDVDVPAVGPSGGYIRDHGSSRVIVFVHGLFSGPDAWRCDDQHYWPAMIAADKDPAFADTDVYVAAYPTPSKHGRMSIDDVDSIIAGRLEADGVFDRHKQVFFVSHSLGGILTQELLLTYRDQNLSQKVGFLFLYGTPQEGSKLANIGKYFSSDPLLKELQEGEGNFTLHDMDDKWTHSGFSAIKKYCAYETQPESGFKVVDKNSATRGCQDSIAISADHRHIVKPCSTRDDAYIDLKNKLMEFQQQQAALSASTAQTQSGVTQQQYNFGGQNFQIGNVYQESPGRRLTIQQIDQVAASLTGTKGHLRIVYMPPVDKEMRDFGEALRLAVRKAGWDQDATMMDTTTHLYMMDNGSGAERNLPQGTHCIAENSLGPEGDLARSFNRAVSSVNVSCYSGGRGYYPPVKGASVAVYIGVNVD